MSKIYYYVNSLSNIFHLETGGVSRLYLDNKEQTGAMHFKNKYAHNFWTETRGGRKIDTFEVFKSKYTYLDL